MTHYLTILSINKMHSAGSNQIVQQVAERITQSVSQVIIGKRNEIRLTVLGLLSHGHHPD
jgi:hypothetical protein